jgi:hypothetical protein
VSSHVNKEVENIDDVLLPIKIWFNGKLFVPVPPRATVNVPDEILEALRDVKLAPEPVKVFAEMSPVTIIKVVPKP